MKKLMVPAALLLAAVMVISLGSSMVFAQEGGDRGDRGGRPGGDRGDRGGRSGGDRGGRGGPGGGGFDFAGMLKERLEISDDEWVAIGPLVTKVFEIQRAGRPSFGGRSGRGGPGGGQSSGNPEADALSATLEKEDASNDEIKAKLAAYRAAREKREKQLKAAREELRAVLSVKQEARLVMMGILD